MRGTEEKIAQLILAEDQIDRDQETIRYLNKRIKGYKEDKRFLKDCRKQLIKEQKDIIFDLMLSLSHRKFCKLVGISNALL